MRYGAMIKLREETFEFYKDMFPFKTNEAFIYLGEVAQMPGHIIMSGVFDGKVYMGWHDENFRELTDEET